MSIDTQFDVIDSNGEALCVFPSVCMRLSFVSCASKPKWNVPFVREYLIERRHVRHNMSYAWLLLIWRAFKFTTAHWLCVCVCHNLMLTTKFEQMSRGWFYYSWNTYDSVYCINFFYFLVRRRLQTIFCLEVFFRLQFNINKKKTEPNYERTFFFITYHIYDCRQNEIITT